MTSDRISLDLIALPAPSPIFGRIVAMLRGWRTRAEQRAALARFDARMLRDIGLTKSDLGHEFRSSEW